MMRLRKLKAENGKLIVLRYKTTNGDRRLRERATEHREQSKEKLNTDRFKI